jgi:2OG-Fe(II) oxygenase superfamily
MTSLLHTIADLDQFPIDRLDQPDGQALLARCRHDLTTNGVTQLPGFLAPAAVEATLAAARDIEQEAWPTSSTHNVYFTALAEQDDGTDPATRPIRSASKTLAYDRFDPSLPLRQLYESAALLDFIRQALDLPVLYRSADPLDALQVTRFEPGDELGWHFDNSEYSITVMLQPPERGGQFEFHPALRTDDDPNIAGVLGVLNGDRTGIHTLPTGPGTVALFRGHRALHRVTPVEGSRPRINSVFTFGDRPDMRLSPLTQQLFYGRNVI